MPAKAGIQAFAAPLLDASLRWHDNSQGYLFIMYKIYFYAPADHAEAVKKAMFAAGAGKIGNYGCCAWQVMGEGQFMPLPGSNAFIGSMENLEKIAEYKVEMVCDASHIHAAITALKKAHPYETPAYQVIKIEDF